jgi:hypothetical protein
MSEAQKPAEQKISLTLTPEEKKEENAAILNDLTQQKQQEGSAGGIRHV